MERKMSNFDYWRNNVADMPTKDDNGWYDLETGLRYDAGNNYQTAVKSARKTVSAKTAESRNIAKFFGGKALKGTAKQVKWAEDIRADKIKKMTEEQATLCCDPAGLLSSAKTWIENRERPASEFAEFINLAKTTREEYAAASAAGDASKVKELSAKYNALTAKWGFK